MTKVRAVTWLRDYYTANGWTVKRYKNLFFEIHSLNKYTPDTYYVGGGLISSGNRTLNKTLTLLS